ERLDQGNDLQPCQRDDERSEHAWRMGSRHTLRSARRIFVDRYRLGGLARLVACHVPIQRRPREKSSTHRSEIGSNSLSQKYKKQSHSYAAVWLLCLSQVPEEHLTPQV